MKTKSTVAGIGLALALNLTTAHGATLQQTAEFDNVTPQRLYQIYLSSKEHAAFTGFPAQIALPQDGGAFMAFGGVGPNGEAGITGKILSVDPGTHDPNVYVIVQTWRGFHDAANDADQTLTLTFKKPAPGLNDNGAEIELVQSNVPEHDNDAAVVSTSWNVRYWQPIRAYLKRLGATQNQ